MALYRVICVLPAYTNVPEDNFTNTLWFQSPEGTSQGTALSAIDVRLDAFYTAISPIFSKVVVGPGQWKAYDMADPEPRVPVGTGTFPLTPPVGGVNLPEEVAMVLSFHAAPLAGAVAARRRGRLYLGPLNQNVTAQSQNAAWTIFQASTRTLVANAASAMANPSSPSGAVWVQYSPTDAAVHPISGGWIDQQPDTQRRRGHRVAGRTLWTAP